MKFSILFSFFLIFTITAFCQPTVKWVFEYKQTNDSIYTVTATANVQPGWYVYAINKGVESALPADFVFDYENITESKDVVYNTSVQKYDDKISGKKVSADSGTVSVSQAIVIRGKLPPVLKGTVTIYAAKGEEFYPIEQTFAMPLGMMPGKTDGAGNAAVVTANTIKISSIDIKNPIANCGATDAGSQSLLTIFLLGFAGGLIALLTPCVFPMIPVTVSFFTKRSPNRKLAVRNGLLYGFFIFLIYVCISIPFHIVGNVNSQIFNNIATNAWLNIVFFIVFIVFAISFFGYFEITLPSSVAGKADEKSNLTSVGGIFFMALTLTIVSFSCTGIILGTLLAGTVSSGAWTLTCGLAGFGVALGLPFALFAIFPSLLASLPKSGGWLDTVKKVLAFVEVALAFKFLSSADLVMHWGLLKREVFVAIWIVIGIGLTLYSFGILRLPHDYKGQKISTGRKVLGLISLLFTLYLVPGLTNTKYANLSLLSGILPPLSYSIYGAENAKGKTLEANVVNDYNKALELSKAQNKPILIDFTGWACTNCRRMEENVWSQPEIYNYIKEHYILVSLYVDDRQKLPVEERIVYKTAVGTEIDFSTIGDKWATFETENFAQQTQPLYAILNTNQILVNHPVGYTPDVQTYLIWLECGVENFGK